MQDSGFDIFKLFIFYFTFIFIYTIILLLVFILAIIVFVFGGVIGHAIIERTHLEFGIIRHLLNYRFLYEWIFLAILFDIMYVDKGANRLYNKEKIYFL